MRAGAAAGPARGRGHERVLHRAAGVKSSLARCSATHPPTGEAHRAPAAARGPAAGGSARAASPPRFPRVGFLDALLGGKKKLKAPAPDRLFAMTTAYVTLETGSGIEHRGQGGDRLPAARHRRLRGDRRATPRSCSPAPRADTGTTVATSDGRVRLPLDRPRATRTSRISSSAINTVSTRSGAAATATACWRPSSRSRTERPARSTSSTTTSAALLPVRAAPGTQQRNTERELQLKAQLGTELPFEPELERWFPLWEIPL